MKQKKIKPYKGFEEDVASLYGPCRIFGPYIRNSDSRRIVLIYYDGGFTTKLYGKVKLEIKLGRVLGKHETVDHKDEDPTNDKFHNLQLLSLKDNVSKSHSLNPNSTQGLVQYSKSKRGRLELSERSSGELNPRALFSSREVERIRRAFSADKETVSSIQRKYRATKGTVLSLLTGKTYQDAGGPIWDRPPGKVGRPKKT